MAIRHHTLVEGNCLSFKGGFFGFSAIVLIEADGHGPILFDTGHHTTRLLLLEALEEKGLAPRDIETIFLSHLHFDHANNIDLFPGAAFYVGAVEWEYAHRPAAEDVFCSLSMNDYLERQDLRLIHESEGELVPGLHYRHVPGHTPGSYLLHYTRDTGERVVLAGDACKTYRELAMLSSANEYDHEHRATESLRWIADNADIVVPGHFPEMRRSPGGWVWDQPSRLELIVR
ncbi:MBL fold metallo-hydrolase [Castellaniella sp. GW247-6E4]|uniref:MBL fold metallo-hydrolase n=1 Tax=Castellaniella sp. GW247-6E4 TaxID=3140380 RepID=UPI0033160E1C